MITVWLNALFGITFVFALVVIWVSRLVCCFAFGLG